MLCFGSPGVDLHHSVSGHAALVAHILKNRGRLAQMLAQVKLSSAKKEKKKGKKEKMSKKTCYDYEGGRILKPKWSTLDNKKNVVQKES